MPVSGLCDGTFICFPDLSWNIDFFLFCFNIGMMVMVMVVGGDW